MARTLRWRGHARQGLQQGFTMMEMMVVIAVLAILLAIAMPRYSSWRASTALQSASNTLMSHIKQARIMAVTSNRDISIVFTSSGYTVDSGGSQSQTYALSAYSGGLSLNDTASTLTFTSAGTSGTETVTLTDDDGDTKGITVNYLGRAYYQ